MLNPVDSAASFFIDLSQGILDTLRAGADAMTGIEVGDRVEVVLKAAYDAKVDMLADAGKAFETLICTNADLNQTVSIAEKMIGELRGQIAQSFSHSKIAVIGGLFIAALGLAFHYRASGMEVKSGDKAGVETKKSRIDWSNRITYIGLGAALAAAYSSYKLSPLA